MVQYQYATIDGHRIFYREGGPANAPAIVLLHGFPSSSHMFRDLIPKLASNFRVVAPDYLGYGFSDQPSASDYSYTFDNLAGLVEKLLFGQLKLAKFSIYVQDYGAPIGFRIASSHPEAIEAIFVQNGNAYVEGIGNAFDPLKAFWANRSAETLGRLCRELPNR
jgi:pimeloyl-ACP methyl ester carboxylesterase